MEHAVSMADVAADKLQQKHENSGESINEFARQLTLYSKASSSSAQHNSPIKHSASAAMGCECFGSTWKKLCMVTPMPINSACASGTTSLISSGSSDTQHPHINRSKANVILSPLSGPKDATFRINCTTESLSPYRRATSRNLEGSV